MRRTFRLTDSVPDPRRDVRDEIGFHLEMRAQELAEQGVPPERALDEAQRRFGDVAAIAAECRELRLSRVRSAFWRDLGRDAAHAVRALAKSPAFTLAAVLTLALGIGAATAVFTVVDGVLLRPLPYRDPESLAMLWLAGQGARGNELEWPISSGFYLAARQGVRGLTSLAAFRSWSFILSGSGPGAGEPEKVAGVRAAPELFATLGVRPFLGRTFTDREALPGGPRVAVLSYGLWQRRFGGDRGAVGRFVTLSGERTQVIGVMPPGFGFPRGAELPPGLQFGARTDLWAPLVFSGEDRSQYGTMNLAVVARRAPGVGLGPAQAEIAAWGKRQLGQVGLPPERFSFYLVSLAEQAAGKVRVGLLVLLGAVGFVLLTACANVANLLIARTGARRREFAVRAALGAGRGRIARQLITENVVLTAAGAALGLLFAVWGTRALLALVPGSLPRADDVGVDLRVVGAALLAALVAAAAFGTAGALHLGSRRGSGGSEALATAGGRTTGGRARRLGRRLLVAVEVGLSLVLLIGAGLLAGSFVRLLRVEPGFDPRHALTAGVLLPTGERFDFRRDGPRWAAFFGELTARLDTAPGIAAAGGVSSLPLTGAVESGGFAIEGRPAPAAGQAPSADYSVVSGNYFRALGLPLLAGRAFDSRDSSSGVPAAVVSREFARRYFPRENPIGRRVRTFFDFGGGPREIVGMVGDVRQTDLAAAPAPAIYVPHSQMPYPFLTLVVRGRGDALATLPVIKRELAALDSTLALSDVRPASRVLSESLARQRFSLVVLGVFAAAALALALVGLYGVIALAVGERRRELGVRVALGAEGRDLLRLVLGEGARVTLIGLAFGLAAALALTRVLESLLYGVSATDWRFFAAATLLVGSVALAAAYLPARRTLAVDGTVAFKEE